MWTFLLGGVAGGWYGTELFEYARSSFVDGYAVPHVLAGCAQADSEYKICPLASSLLFIQTSTFKFFSPKILCGHPMAPASFSKTPNHRWYVRVAKKDMQNSYVPSFVCRYHRMFEGCAMPSSPPGLSQDTVRSKTWPPSFLAIPTYNALSTYKSLH